MSSAEIPVAWRVPLHVLFEALGYVCAALLYVRLRRRGDVIAESPRTAVLAAAAVGAALGSRLLSLLEDPRHLHLRDILLLDAGKTIIGGILGAWIAVELTKRRIGVGTRTGDLFVFPLALGTVVGRIGCFLAGTADATYGRVTNSALGVDFGEGVRRYPLQLFELAGIAVIVLILARTDRARLVAGDLFRLYVFGYMALRFALEFLKDGYRVVGLTSLQWAALAGMLCCAPTVLRMVRREESRALAVENVQ